MERTFYAWTAGIVDGEGCITLKRNGDILPKDVETY
jgi:hypothetical protein